MNARLFVTAGLILLAAALLWATAAQGAGRVSFAPGLSTWYEYTDNLLLTPEDAEVPKYKDHSLNVQPAAHLIYESPVTRAAIGGSVAFKWYRKHTEYNGLPDYASANALWSRQAGPRTRVELSDNLTFFYDPREAFGARPSAETSAHFIPVRSQSIGNAASAMVEQIFSTTSSAQAQYTFATTEVKAPELFDVVTHMAQVGWRQRISERHAIIPFARYSRNLYNHDFDFIRRLYSDKAKKDPPFPTRLKNPADFDTYVPGIGLDYQMTPSLSFEVRSGLIFPAQYRDGDYRIYDLDWYQRLAVAKRWPRLRLTGSYTRDLAPAHGVGAAVLGQNYTANFMQIWMTQLQSYVEGSYERGRQDLGRIDGYRWTAAIDYFPLRWLSVGGGAQHFEQFSRFGDIRTKIYQNRLLLRISLGMPRPDFMSFML